MIVKLAQIYDQVALKNNLDKELVSSIGSSVFASLLEGLMKPYEIAYELPKLGTFILKHKPFENYYRHYMRFVNSGAIKNQVDIERVKGLRERVDRFRETKNQKRRERSVYRENSSK